MSSFSFSSHLKGYVRAGKCYTYLGQLKEARDIYANALKQDANNQEIIGEVIILLVSHPPLLLTYIKRKGLERIEAALKRATEGVEKKEYTTSLRESEFVLASAPNLLAAKLVRANALLGLKQYSVAMSVLGYYPLFILRQGVRRAERVVG